MTDQPTTSHSAAGTTGSARETLHHLAHLTADPYIPEVHDDEDDTDTTALDLDDIATRAAHLAEYTDLPAAADRLAGQDVPALLAAVDRLRAERDDLAARIGQLERPAVETNRREQLHTALYAALVAFQTDARLPALQHAQRRDHLAEHLTAALLDDGGPLAELSKADRLWRGLDEENGTLFDKLMAAENKRDELEAERATTRAEVLREAADRLGQRADWLAGEYADSGISGEGPEAVLGAWRAAERELRRMAAAAPAGAEDGDRRA